MEFATEAYSTALSPASLALIAAASWVLVSLFVSLLGWSQLAEIYQHTAPFRGRRFRFQSGGFRRGAGYNLSLTVGVDQAGLFLSVLPMLRIGHPPLLIPWSEIEVAEVRALLVRRTELRFRGAPRVRFRITPKLAERLAAAVPERWPIGGQSETRPAPGTG